jgi:hypothetical protein
VSTNPLTDARRALATALEELLPGWHVYPSPPASIVPPCAVIAPAPRGLERTTFGTWAYPLEVLLYALGADEGTLATIEAATCTLCATWELEPGNAPGAAMYGGSTYVGASVVVTEAVAIPVTPTTTRKAS